MGLDMDFYKVNTNGKKEHLHYFRKHADLHGVLLDCYLEKNPDKNPSDFNCVDFEVTKNEVKRIKKFMKERPTHYHGFFWGTSTEEDWEETKTLFKEISSLLKENYKIIYTPWW